MLKITLALLNLAFNLFRRYLVGPTEAIVWIGNVKERVRFIMSVVNAGKELYTFGV